MTSFPWAAPMREFGRAGPDEFAEIRKSGQPAVFRGIAAEWPAVTASREGDDAFVAYLKRFCTAQRVGAIMGPPEIGGRFFYNDDLTDMNFQRGVTLFEPFLDRLLRDRGEATPHAIAVQSELVQEILPGFEIENRVEMLHRLVQPRAWIGNRVQVAPHYDLYENIGVVVAGRRRFTVFPPEQVPNLYAGPFELTPAGTPISLVELANPDLERFPKFRDAMAAAQCAVLEPGDAIYIPYYWWHAVDSLEAVNLFINYWWNDAPREGGRPYDALVYGFFAFKTLPAEQRAVWRNIFDHYVFQTNGDPGEHLPVQARGVLGAPTPALLDRIRRGIKKIADSL